MLSTKAVAIENRADTHIHKIAPGPPTLIAPVTPRILPGPTRIAEDNKNEANGEIPLRFFVPENKILIACLK